ncbi:hypothetical protein M9H77_25952 [Catharanthus roseus]|uniref:Uncharacterized protein n=1 Tax=Catharanthus roseus TaxID=4058 RepID=A0ACC0A8K5_CATRO|nr:hypothetical protein M9H77_25952 [Catharanthus roseus]
MAMCENWQVFVHEGRHNHAIGVYTHGHAQAAKLTEEQLIQIEKFRKTHVPPLPRKYITSLRTLRRIRCRGETRNREDSNMLNDIVVTHPTSIEMLRTWPYVQHATVGSGRDDPDW